MCFPLWVPKLPAGNTKQTGLRETIAVMVLSSLSDARGREGQESFLPPTHCAQSDSDLVQAVATPSISVELDLCELGPKVMFFQGSQECTKLSGHISRRLEDD